MSRPRHIWTVFALCAAVVLAGVAWLSTTVLRLQRAEARAAQQATIEESVRLALWRMDSALTTLIARESARPYFMYSSFYPAERAYTRMFSEIGFGDVLVPSPLLTQTSPLILVHFQIDAAGSFSSPQAPPGRMRDLAETRYATRESIEAAAQRLEELRERLDRDGLVAALPLEATPSTGLVFTPPAPEGIPPLALQRQSPTQQVEQQQAFRNYQESQARRSAAQQANTAARDVPNQVTGAVNVTEGALQPLWSNGLLLLARRVSVAGAEYVQGCWLDWPAIQRSLGATVLDLFPHAHFEPVTDAAAGSAGHVLAALPVRVEPGLPALILDEVGPPTWLFLIIVWVCVLLAAVAVVVLLIGIVSLSERRAAFVSAVTHEMRTPLTTFRLYTDMLTEGMVHDEAMQRRYLKTLHAEAMRLGHLVENVLAYARLEHGRADTHMECMSLSQLLQHVRELLADRAAQAEMRLVIQSPDESLAAASVQAMPSAVEQILLNLVDNACKYAVDADTREIHIGVERAGRMALLRVRDSGPGVSSRDARHLFRPFRKSARDAAHSAPGVGLGLALSRRLARSMGGDLRLVRVAGDGACFELALRLAADE